MSDGSRHTHLNPAHAKLCFICSQQRGVSAPADVVQASIAAPVVCLEEPLPASAIECGYLEIGTQPEPEKLSEIPALFRRQRADFEKKNMTARYLKEMVDGVCKEQFGDGRNLEILTDPKRLRAGIDDSEDWVELEKLLEPTEAEKNEIHQKRLEFRKLVLENEFSPAEKIEIPENVKERKPLEFRQPIWDDVTEIPPLHLPLLEGHLKPELGCVVKPEPPPAITEDDLPPLPPLPNIPLEFPDFPKIPDLLGPAQLFHYSFKEAEIPPINIPAPPACAPVRVAIPEKDKYCDFDSEGRAIPRVKRMLKQPLLRPSANDWASDDTPELQEWFKSTGGTKPFSIDEFVKHLAAGIPVDESAWKDTELPNHLKSSEPIPASIGSEVVGKEPWITQSRYMFPPRELEFPSFLKEIATSNFKAESLAEILNLRAQALAQIRDDQQSTNQTVHKEGLSIQETNHLPDTHIINCVIEKSDIIIEPSEVLESSVVHETRQPIELINSDEFIDSLAAKLQARLVDSPGKKSTNFHVQPYKYEAQTTTGKVIQVAGNEVVEKIDEEVNFGSRLPPAVDYDFRSLIITNKGELLEPDPTLIITNKFNLQTNQDDSGTVVSERGAQLLFNCVKHNRFEDIRSVLEEDATLVDALDDLGNSLLHIAATNNNKRVARLLLKVGARVDARNKKGDTPLHCAYRMKFVDLAQYLLANGADDQIRNNDNVTPHMLMLQN